MGNPPKLYPFQETGIQFVKANHHVGLWDDMGLGKSAQAICAAEGKTLVITPAMLKGTWEEELAKWADDPSRFTWVSYHSLCAKDGRKTKPEAKPEYQQEQWDTIILDECQHCKNRKALWTQAISKLKTKRLVLLTGTPIPNWAHELFTNVKWLHPGSVDYRSYWDWIYKWFNTWNPSWGGVQIEGLKKGLTWTDFYKGNDLDKLTLRRTREEVLPQLPQLTEQYIEVDMVPAQRRLYNQLKTEYLAWIEENGEEISAFSDGALSIKLAKVQTGICAIDPEVSKWESNKIALLKELLEARGGEPTVVVCHFRNTAAVICKLLSQLDLKYALIQGGDTQAHRDEAKNAFQRGELNVLVGTLDTISEGLTLTKADCLVFVERSWKPYKNEQAKRRIHRIGQTRPVNIIYLISKDALDSRITEVLNLKQEEQSLALSAGKFATLL